MAGAELRPTGSSKICGSATPASRSCSATRKRCSWLHTTTGGAKPGPTPRRAVSTIIERSLFSSPQNCLGKLSRDTGHSRVPEPPDRMTGTTSPPALPAAAVQSGAEASASMVVPTSLETVPSP